MNCLISVSRNEISKSKALSNKDFCLFSDAKIRKTPSSTFRTSTRYPKFWGSDSFELLDYVRQMCVEKKAVYKVEKVESFIFKIKIKL